MIKFSIIIPHFTKSNTELLERAVNSIPERQDIEILIVDNSPSPIKGNLFINRNNVKIFFSDNTKGAGHARNVGIDNSKGKWLLFLDADDFFTESAFSAFDSYVDSTYDIIFFKTISCYSDTLEPTTRHKSYTNIIENYFIDKNEYALRYQFPSPWAKMVKSSLVKKHNIRYDEVPAANDVIFALKIGIAAKTISASLSEVYCTTINKGSITNTTSLKNIESRFNVSIRKNQLLKKNGLKKKASVIYFLLKSSSYGLKPFFKLFFKALFTQNLFVGYNNWIKTTFKLASQRNKKDKKYKVFEK